MNFAVVILSSVFQIINIVPQQEAWVIERFGKFNRIITAGLTFLIPFVDRIAYVHSLKEVAMEVNSQTAVTQDNVRLELDGVLYMKVNAHSVLVFRCLSS